jgi:hypothetical protein
MAALAARRGFEFCVLKRKGLQPKLEAFRVCAEAQLRCLEGQF